jgi:uncharacterized membrane protein YqaE (UPF0057 family)
MSNKKDYDPEDTVVISKRHWNRKQNVVNGNDKLASLATRPGPVTGIIITLFDGVVTVALRFIVALLGISTYAFEYINNITFGNFKGIFPNEMRKGKTISLKFFRYTMTVLMPPMGIFLSKGLYGWFNIIVCAVITYINFLAGIIYAFVITMRNRYADQYEEYQIKKAIENNPQEKANADSKALLATVGFILMIGFTIYFCIGYF